MPQPCECDRLGIDTSVSAMTQSDGLRDSSPRIRGKIACVLCISTQKTDLCTRTVTLNTAMIHYRRTAREQNAPARENA